MRIYYKDKNFNPRPRKEGDLANETIPETAKGFQSTPSQRGRPLKICRLYHRKAISIHALAKRATNQSACLDLRYTISIHALAKRATAIQQAIGKPTLISIHALAKRATANLYNDYLYFEAKYHISDIFPL